MVVVIFRVFLVHDRIKCLFAAVTLLVKYPLQDATVDARHHSLKAICVFFHVLNWVMFQICIIWWNHDMRVVFGFSNQKIHICQTSRINLQQIHAETSCLGQLLLLQCFTTCHGTKCRKRWNRHRSIPTGIFWTSYLRGTNRLKQHAVDFGFFDRQKSTGMVKLESSSVLVEFRGKFGGIAMPQFPFEAWVPCPLL